LDIDVMVGFLEHLNQELYTKAFTSLKLNVDN